MDLALMGRGLIIGLAIAAPVGPIGLLCIRRTLSQGRAAGFVSGLGAAAADAVYAAVAGFGISVFTSLVVGQAGWLRLLGGGALIYLGARTVLTRPAGTQATVGGRGLAGAFLSTFALTLTNPTTILSFAAVFAGLGSGHGASDIGTTLLLVGGVFGGSALWWLLLSHGANLFRSRLGPGGLRWVNIVSGAIIAAFGLGALISGLVS